MKNTIALAAVLAVFVAGCGKKEETTITTPDGTSVSVKQDTTGTTGGADISVKSTGGDVNASIGGVTETDLGLPFYTGSVEDAQGASAKTEVNGMHTVVSMRTSKDDPSKVVDFYKAKVKNPVPAVTDAGGMKNGALTGELDNGAKVAIAAMKTGTEDTKISVTVTTTK